MKTLLSLFYVPYLRFLAKFHLIAVLVLALIYLLRLRELMVLAPGLYSFALYATTNRHQFKDNIPWMLATFNKRTLITYHLVSQTLVMALLVFLASLGVIVTTIASITLLVKSPDKAPAQEEAAKLLNFAWMSTQEQAIIAVAAIFFLTTLYSPVSLKDYLRQMEEHSEKWKKFTWPGVGVAVGLALMHWQLELGLKDFILPLLGFILVGQVLYLVAIYNRAFILFHPRHYRRLLPAGAGLAVVLSCTLGGLSYQRMQTSQHADQRVAELAFLGVFAPALNDEEFLQLVRGVKDPGQVLEVFAGKREVPLKVKQTWLVEANDFTVAIQVIDALSEGEETILNHPGVWAKLDKLYYELHAKNAAAAQWRLSKLMRELNERSWRPQDTSGLTERPVLEQVAILEWQRKNEAQVYVKTLQDPLVKPAVLDLHLQRAPASRP